MHEIVLTGTIGQDQFYYRAIMPHRKGWDFWHLYFGDLFQGQLIWAQGEWRTYLVSPTKKNDGGSWITSEDIQVIIEQIEKQKLI